MKELLSADQIADLADIRKICDEMGADLVIIGATALLLSWGELGRFTRDVDLCVALDLNEFANLRARLTGAGWKQAPRVEYRWTAPRKTMVDLIPAGSELRRAGRICWPTSELSLAGFDQVFATAVETHIGHGVRIRVTTPIVSALLKIIAYMDNPYVREKDLHDIRMILSRYEEESDRQFSDQVFDAELEDFCAVNAFLVGVDLRNCAAREDAKYVKRFLDHFLNKEEEESPDDSGSLRTFRSQIRAFHQGFTGK